MMTDPLADMLTRIRNALLRGKPTVITPASKLRENVLSVLQDEGYIRGFMKLEIEGEFPMFEIELKYHEGDPVIKKLERVSKPEEECIPLYQNYHAFLMGWCFNSIYFKRRNVRC